MFFLLSCEESKDTSEIIITDDMFKEYITEFEPTQREGVSDGEFELGKVRFENTLNKNNNGQFNFDSGDYWKLFLGQISLSEPINYTRYTFFKAYELNPEIICVVLQVQQTDANGGFQRIINIVPEVQKIVDTCQVKELPIEDETSLTCYSTESNFDYDLVNLFEKIEEADQKYRGNIETYGSYKIQQDDIDTKNQRIIDSLFNIHKEYIGESYVGNKYKHVMWLVIQHSNLKKMEKYFPVMSQAVKNGELSEDAFKMMIDRMYHFEYGYQIFGSQVGVEIAPDTIRKKVVHELNF